MLPFGPFPCRQFEHSRDFGAFVKRFLRDHHSYHHHFRQQDLAFPACDVRVRHTITKFFSEVFRPWVIDFLRTGPHESALCCPLRGESGPIQSVQLPLVRTVETCKLAPRAQVMLVRWSAIRITSRSNEINPWLFIMNTLLLTYITKPRFSTTPTLSATACPMPGPLSATKAQG